MNKYKIGQSKMKHYYNNKSNIILNNISLKCVCVSTCIRNLLSMCIHKYQICIASKTLKKNWGSPATEDQGMWDTGVKRADPTQENNGRVWSFQWVRAVIFINIFF